MADAKRMSQQNRILGTALLISCFFGNFAPFLNIDLQVIILTPFRWMLILVSAFCFVIWVKRLKNHRAVHILKGHKLKTAVFLFFAVWSLIGVFWLVFGTCNSMAPTEVMGIVTICAMAFCLFTLINDTEDVRYYLRLCVAAGLVMAVLANIEVVIGALLEGTAFYYTLEERIDLGQTLFPPTVVFHNTNDLASFFLLCLAIVAFWTIKAKTGKELAACGIIAIVLLSPAPNINSTIFNISFLVLLAITFLCAIIQRDENYFRRIAKSAGSILLAVFYLIPFSACITTVGRWMNYAYFTKKIQKVAEQNAVQNPHQVAETTESIVATQVTETSLPSDAATEYPIPTTLPQEDASATADTLMTQLAAAQEGYGTIHIRLWLIRAGWDFFCQRPLLGWGPGSFRDKMQENRHYYLETRAITDPHNFYIEVLAQYGGILFIWYMGLVIYMLIKSVKRALSELKTKTAGTGVCATMLLIMFSIAVIIPSSSIRLSPLWVFFILAVCAMSCDSSHDCTGE